MLKIGVLSDTHGYLDRQIPEIFAGVDHILHAGDIGYPSLILELEDIAPVTAIAGNNDEGTDYRETELLVLGNRKFILHHQLEPRSLTDKIQRRIIRENPDVVVFGHTHKQFCETIGQTLFFNPGYAGKPRFGHLRSVAVLLCDDTGITAEFRELSSPPVVA